MGWLMTHFSPMLALALVAAIGYWLGRRSHQAADELLQQTRRELRRAQAVATELDHIATKVRRSLARHHGRLKRFRQRVGRLENGQREASWKDLCLQAEEMLHPTQRLAVQISEAYEQLCLQTAQLMSFTELRSDPLTGVNNRRAFDDALAMQFALLHRYDTEFSLVMFDIDHFKQVNDELGHLEGDRVLRQFAQLVDESVRDTDVVARFGGEEFVVILPQTDLAGACTFAERLRRKIEQLFSFTVSGGVAVALDGDTPDSLVGRVDAALYHAKSAGRNCVFRHTGERMEGIVEAPTSATHP